MLSTGGDASAGTAVEELSDLATVRPGAVAGWLSSRCQGGDGAADRVATLATRAARNLRDRARLGPAAVVVAGAVDLLEGRADLDEGIEVELIRAVGEIYSYHGRPQTGIELCQRMREPRSVPRRIDRLVVLAALCRDDGQLARARALSDQSLFLVEELDDPARHCRILNNRGVLHLDQGRFDDAASDLLRARRLAEDHGLAYEASSCTHNLGVARARHGRVNEAFQLFDESLLAFGRLGSSYAMLAALVDRVAVLYDVGLLGDARAAAELSAASHRRFASHAGLEETIILQVRIEVADGEWAAAAGHCAELLALLEERSAPVERRRFVRRQLDLLQSLTGESRLLSVNSDGDRDLLRPLHASTAVEIGLYCGHQGRSDDARYLFELVLQRQGGREEEIHRCVASAHLAAERGDRRGVLSAIEDGFEHAVTSGACLGPFDLRATTLRRVGQLSEIGMEIARRDDDPHLAAGLANRALAIASAREPDLSERETELLARLREVHHAFRWSEVDDTRGAYLVGELSRIEGELTSVRRHRRGDRADPVATVPSGPLASGSRLLHLTRIGADAVAIVIGAGGGHFVELGPFDRLARRVGALLVMLDAAAAGIIPAADVVRARDGLRQLLDPILGPGPAEATVVVADPRLPPVPWSLITSGPLSHLPWISQDTAPVAPSPDATLSIIQGPGLDGVDVEFGAIAAAWPGARRAGEPLTTVSEARLALERSDLIHVSAHGRFRRDNPLFSEIALADGPLTLYDLIGSPMAARHVVLATCELGSRSFGSPLGAFAVLQTCGCRTMIASAGRIRDAAMSELMGRYYRELDGLTTPAAALAAAQRALVDDDPSVAQILAFGPA